MIGITDSDCQESTDNGVSSESWTPTRHRGRAVEQRRYQQVQQVSGGAVGVELWCGQILYSFARQ